MVCLCVGVWCCLVCVFVVLCVLCGVCACGFRLMCVVRVMCCVMVHGLCLCLLCVYADVSFNVLVCGVGEVLLDVVWFVIVCDCLFVFV